MSDVETKQCQVCEETKPVLEFDFYSTISDNGEVILTPGKRCNQCRAIYAQRRRLRVRYELIKSNGGCCTICGDSDLTHPSLFEFHYEEGKCSYHRTKKDKAFAIMCVRCHRILHEKEITKGVNIF
jgi:hypothetical protein